MIASLDQSLVDEPVPFGGGNRVAEQEHRKAVEGGLGHPVGRRGDAGPPRHRRQSPSDRVNLP